MRPDEPGESLPAALYCFEGIDEVATVALFALFQRLWFRRAWIVQEVVLAKNLVIACGGALLCWEVMELVMSQIVKRGLFPSLCGFSKAIMTGTATDKILRRHAKFGRPVACFRHQTRSGTASFAWIRKRVGILSTELPTFGSLSVEMP
jgi:hypothetical protein